MFTCKVSVVVTAYNTEKYLAGCLKSVINQSLKDIEIIIINDGSVDNSEKICLDFLNYDNRIKYFLIEHSGVSEARNFGLSKAIGEYIYFLDADDTINDTFLESSYKTGIENDSDIVFVDRQWEIADITKLCVMQNSVMFYKKSFLDKYSFFKFNKELIFGEDVVFAFMTMALTDKKSINTKSHYFYRKHKHMSTLNLSFKKKYDFVLRGLYILKDFIESENLSKKYLWFLGKYIQDCVLQTTFFRICLKDFAFKRKIYYEIKDFFNVNIKPFITDEEFNEYGYEFKRFLLSKNYFRYELKNQVLSNKIGNYLFNKYRRIKKSS